MIDMAIKQIIPSVIGYTTSLSSSVRSIREVSDSMDVSVQTELLTKISSKLAEMNKALKVLEAENAKAAAFTGDIADQAAYYRDHVFTAMAALRVPADELEMMVDQKVWPFPTYGDLLFNV